MATSYGIKGFSKDAVEHSDELFGYVHKDRKCPRCDKKMVFMRTRYLGGGIRYLGGGIRYDFYKCFGCNVEETTMRSL